MIAFQSFAQYSHVSAHDVIRDSVDLTGLRGLAFERFGHIPPARFLVRVTEFEGGEIQLRLPSERLDTS
jgi:hypothetical protein